MKNEELAQRKKSMIVAPLAEALVLIIQKFQYSGNLYQTFGLWAKDKALLGCADYLFKQAKERRHSAKYLHEWLDSVGVVWNSEAVEEAIPERTLNSIETVFDLSLENEIGITDAINKIAVSANSCGCFITLLQTSKLLKFQIGEEDEARDHLAIAATTKDSIVVDIRVASILKAKKKQEKK